jgi:hypothetical protein
MTQNQIRGGQIRSGTIANEQIASNAEIAISKIAGGTNLVNRVTDLESDAVVTREVPSGSVNGSNVTFTLANTPVAGSEQVFLNGLLQDPGAGNSYTISGAVITFFSAPLSGDEIHVTYATGDYMVAPGGSGGGSSISVYQDTQFSWSYNTNRDIVHNKGRRPDLIRVFHQDPNNSRWAEAPDVYFHEFLSPQDRGWLDATNSVDPSTTARIYMLQPVGGYGSTPQTRIRLYWFTPQDVGTASAGWVVGG